MCFNTSPFFSRAHWQFAAQMDPLLFINASRYRVTRCEVRQASIGHHTILACSEIVGQSRRLAPCFHEAYRPTFNLDNVASMLVIHVLFLPRYCRSFVQVGTSTGITLGFRAGSVRCGTKRFEHWNAKAQTAGELSQSMCYRQVILTRRRRAYRI